MESIVRHIFSELAIIPSEFIDYNRSHSLLDKQYALSSKIKFEGDEESGKQSGQVWGCQISTENQEIKILLGNCSQEKGILEYALIVQLKDAPVYGMYLIHTLENIPSEPMLACSVNGNEWMECNTFLQASFLTGMEQIKEMGLGWNKCIAYEKEFEKLLSFIQYHDLVYGATNEGQEG